MLPQDVDYSLCSVEQFSWKADSNQEFRKGVLSVAHLSSAKTTAMGIIVPLLHQKSQTIPITVKFRALNVHFALYLISLEKGHTNSGNLLHKLMDKDLFWFLQNLWKCFTDSMTNTQLFYPCKPALSTTRSVFCVGCIPDSDI